MKRVRRAGAILAILALTLSFGEWVLASLCATMPGMPSMAEVTSEDMTAESVAMHGDMMAANDEPVDSRADERELPPCPFGPFTVAQGCMGSAHLPSAAAHLRNPVTEHRISTSSDKSRHELLLAVALFHPPKA
jgi:hypothetical protein